MEKKVENHPISASTDLPQHSLMTSDNLDVHFSSNISINQQNYSSDIAATSNITNDKKTVTSNILSSDEYAERRDKENTEFHDETGVSDQPSLNSAQPNNDFAHNDINRSVVSPLDVDSKLLSNNISLVTPSDKNSAHSDDSNNATTNPSSINAVDSKRHQVEKALGFLELVRKKYTKQPAVYSGFLNLMRSFKTHRLSEESVSLKEIVDKVKGIFEDNGDLFECFSEFVIGDKRSDNMGGLIDAANNIASINATNNVELNSVEKLNSDSGEYVDNDVGASNVGTVRTVSPNLKYDPPGNCLRIEIGCSNESIQNESLLPRPNSNINEISQSSSSTLPISSRISASNSINSNNSPRVVSSIQHRPPPIYSSHPPIVDGTGIPAGISSSGTIRPIYSPHAPQMIPPPLPPGYRTFSSYPGGPPNQPPPHPASINQYGSRHHNPQHHGMVHTGTAGGSSVPIVGVPREAYCSGYRNPTSNILPSIPPNNLVPTRRTPRTPANFSALQSALYHNIATSAGGPSPHSSNGEIATKPLQPSNRPYSYTSTSSTVSTSKNSNNELSNVGGSAAVSSSPTLQSASQNSNNCSSQQPQQHQQQNSVYHSKVGSNSTGVSSTNNPRNQKQHFNEDDPERFKSHPYVFVSEFQDSFDRGAFDFASTVKMYFTDVLKKPRSYQEFVRNLREYQNQHEIIEMAPLMSCEEKKIKENELLKKLMDNVSELFNQNVELINSFLHYLPSLNSTLSTASLAPYHDTFANKQPSSNFQSHQAQQHSSNDNKMNNSRSRNQNLQTFGSNSVTSDLNRYAPSTSSSIINNSTHKGSTPASLSTSTSSVLSNVTNAITNLNSNANKFAATSSLNNAPNAVRGTNTFIPFSNKQGTKPPTIATSRRAQQSQVNLPYGRTAGQFDPNLILQIFSEIRAVTNVRDYTNILKFINMYNLNIVTFTELLFLIKSITYNNKIAYSKMRTIFKNMAEFSLEFDTIFPEIFYPGSETPMKNRTYRSAAGNIAVDNQIPSSNQPTAHPYHNVSRPVISRNAPTPISSSNNNMASSNAVLNSNYYPMAPVTNVPVGYQVPYNNIINSAHPPRAQRIAGAAPSRIHAPSGHVPRTSNHIDSANQVDSYVMKKNAETNAFVESLSATQHARFYLDHNKRISSSYFLLGPSTPHWVCSGKTSLADSVLNNECLSEAHTALEERTTNTTTAAFTRNLYEEELTRVEEERFELDVLLDLLISVRTHFRDVLANEKFPTSDDVFDNRMKFFIYKSLENLYGDNFPKVVKALKLDPLSSLRVVIPRIDQKIKEWRASKLHLEEYWRKITIKNYLKALDYSFQSFKSNDMKRIKGKVLLKEIEQLSSGTGGSNESKKNIDNGDNTIPAHLTLTYVNQLIISNATHLIMFHAKRQSTLNSDEKSFIEKLLVNDFLPMFFCNSNLQDEHCKQKFDNWFHFFATDDIYVFFRLHNILCDRLLKIYDICKDVFKMLEVSLSANSFGSNSNLINTASKSSSNSSSQIAYRYPFLLSKSNKHKFTFARKPRSFHQLFNHFIELVQGLLEGHVETEVFEDECRFMFGTQCYVIFTVDRLVQECVKYLNFMAFNPPSQNLIELFLKFGPIFYPSSTVGPLAAVSDNHYSLIEYKREMIAIMKPHNYYIDMVFNRKELKSDHPNWYNEECKDGLAQSFVITKIFHRQSFDDEKDPPDGIECNSTYPTLASDIVASEKDTEKLENFTAFSTHLISIPSDHITAPQSISHIIQCNNSNEPRNIVNICRPKSKCDFDVGANYSRSILTNVNFDEWRSYVSYFTRNDSPSPKSSNFDVGDSGVDGLKPLNDELNFAREKSLFMVKILRLSTKRLPSQAKQIMGLIKHLYNNDPSSDSAVFDSSTIHKNCDNTSTSGNISPSKYISTALAELNSTQPTTDSGSFDTNNKLYSNKPLVVPSSRNTHHLSKIDQYSNGLIIFDNETYALEPVAFKLQFLRDSYYFLFNKYSSTESLKILQSTSSTLPHGSLLESILCKNRSKPSKVALTIPNNVTTNLNVGARRSKFSSRINDKLSFTSKEDYKL